MVSESFERLRIVSDFHFTNALELVKSRSPKIPDRDMPLRSDGNGLLTGIIYCGSCGSRLTFNHQKIVRETSTGTHVYERDMYRCYRKINHNVSCNGQTTYKTDDVEQIVLGVVQQFFKNILSQPTDDMLSLALNRDKQVKTVALKQAESELKKAQNEITKLENEVVKAITGETSLDITFLNQIIQKRRATLESVTIEYSRLLHEAEEEAKGMKTKVDEISRIKNWAETFDAASFETRKMILAHLIEGVFVYRGYRIDIRFKLTAKQFLGQTF